MVMRSVTGCSSLVHFGAHDTTGTFLRSNLPDREKWNPAPFRNGLLHVFDPWLIDQLRGVLETRDVPVGIDSPGRIMRWRLGHDERSRAADKDGDETERAHTADDLAKFDSYV